MPPGPQPHFPLSKHTHSPCSLCSVWGPQGLQGLCPASCMLGPCYQVPNLPRAGTIAGPAGVPVHGPCVSILLPLCDSRVVSNEKRGTAWLPSSISRRPCTVCPVEYSISWDPLPSVPVGCSASGRSEAFPGLCCPLAPRWPLLLGTSRRKLSRVLPDRCSSGKLLGHQAKTWGSRLALFPGTATWIPCFPNTCWGLLGP